MAKEIKNLAEVICDITNQINGLEQISIYDAPMCEAKKENARQINAFLEKNPREAIAAFLDFVKDEEFAGLVDPAQINLVETAYNELSALVA